MPSVAEEYRELGSFLRETRRNLAVTQSYVADRTRVSGGYICQVERGKATPSDAFLLKLEMALELRAGTLFLKIGKPPFDLVRTLVGPEPLSDAPTNITPSEL